MPSLYTTSLAQKIHFLTFTHNITDVEEFFRDSLGFCGILTWLIQLGDPGTPRQAFEKEDIMM